MSKRERIFSVERGEEGEVVVRFRLPEVLPKHAREHFRAAGKELVLGLRSLARAVEEEKKSPPTRIDIE